MKKFLLAIFTALAAYSPAAAVDGDLFPYPKPPADMERLDERCNYLVTHFWDRADFKSAFSKREALHNTFGDWIGFMPYASADSVHAAIDRLLARSAKSPEQILAIGRMAEQWVYSDTAQIFSEEIYRPFAAAVASNKKIKAADRARFENHVRIIDNTTTGKPVGHVNLIKPDGSHTSLDSIHTQMIVLLFNDYDCDDCSLARVRLSADINANALIRAGLLTVLSIQPGEASPEWIQAAASYPDNWVVGADTDADEWFALRSSPYIMLLDSRHRLLAKGIDINGLLAAMAHLKANSGI